MRRTVRSCVVALAVFAGLVLPGTALATHTPQVGEIRNWVGLDNVGGVLYAKPYRLMAVGPHIEIWVANVAFTNPGNRGGAYGLEFPSNERARARGFDCRSALTQITEAQAQYMADEFERVMYPRSSSAFSVPPNRDGSRAQAAIRNSPLFHPGGPGERIVTLVDNVRDTNFYSYQNEGRHSYIAGFFSGQINELFDRNFMTNDAFDWLHRTTANPPDNSFPGPLPPIGTLTRLCGHFPASPYLYEGTFIHEYQHLLEYYESPGEESWINEGLSDYAQTLGGYVDATVHPYESGLPLEGDVGPPNPDADSHIWCFAGFLPLSLCGGPENSLNLWNDGDEQNENLADYGITYILHLMLADRYGLALISDLHREDLNGVAGLQAVLNRRAGGKLFRDLVNELAALVALDKVLDEGRTLTGGTAATYMSPSLRQEVNWSTVQAYGQPGAPPNGSDYVRARDAAGSFLSASQINSISFDGQSTLPADPVAWRVVTTGPADAANPALWSGTGNNLDRAIVREVAVPATGATMTLRHQYNLENHWDFGFVQVSTDGGATYRSIACTGTTTETDPDAIPSVKANVPGYTGDSGAIRTDTCDLSAFAGRTVLLAFRFIADPAVEGESNRIPPGWFIYNAAIGGTVITNGSNIGDFRSPTQVRPLAVSGWTVQIVGWHTTNRSVPAFIHRMTLDANFDGTLSGAALQSAIGSGADLVGIIVTYNEPTGTLRPYARYRLTVNGVLQPGGGTA